MTSTSNSTTSNNSVVNSSSGFNNNTMMNIGIKVTKVDCNTNDIEYNYSFDPSEKFKNWVNEGVENYKLVNDKWKSKNKNKGITATVNNNNNNNNSNDINGDISSNNNSSTTNNRNNTANDIRNVDAIQVIDELLNKNGVFSKRVPLPDLISILVEEWEANENTL
ncbi:hypothetical protein PPL_06765 [Heterostelium album PN500]|uniref:Gag1-like clamp domain-containing protein n=1 Tax=Heterostelium pallidum (strain ATCC 26659 / Pp 5 / PN500) TaxID=670386 RepID=D3BFN0_HETP5|nr:hypothetical protein PPL_06765 [Heterostelium album PN500]EFA79944.1 hypothetical protein PPL_06765 [Heterostelium album PN500]|eukprot:XP_020432064.1 hypothetical protein PPL_06765 [Heterostelium album PN500]